MGDAIARRSRRVAGVQPTAPPPPSVAKPNTSLHTLLSVDSKNGRGFYKGAASTAWQLDGKSPAPIVLCSPCSVAADDPADDRDDGVRRRLAFIAADDAMIVDNID